MTFSPNNQTETLTADVSELSGNQEAGDVRRQCRLEMNRVYPSVSLLEKRNENIWKLSLTEVRTQSIFEFIRFSNPPRK